MSLGTMETIGTAGWWSSGDPGDIQLIGVFGWWNEIPSVADAILTLASTLTQGMAMTPSVATGVALASSPASGLTLASTIKGGGS